ncbi:plasmid mobilization relaxosome protein MobC [Streptomyces sp. NPDC057963]|uniref:plasmid mobilization relaxosome protein MobC n=1 Tax=Streptomyces sp. NPDC057963 TaxID=3346290 RepID=UPI0036F0852B
MAEAGRRQGAPDREAGTEGGPDLDTLHAAQRVILHPAHLTETVVAEPAAKGVQPANRRFNGHKRVKRVGPLRFVGEELALLEAAAAEHGYRGVSGLAADVVLAFLYGRFVVHLPLSEDRRRLHEFRAQVLRHLHRIGVNVNQIARALNSDVTPIDLRERLDELLHLLRVIAEALHEPADPTEV